MERLKGLESLCLHLESADTPMHVSSLSIYDQSTAPGGHVRFDDVLRHFRDRAHRSGILRRRVAGVPGSLVRPYWIEDRRFDLEYHLRHIALPAPGDWAQLCTQVARIHERSLDLERPLWECYFIEAIGNVAGVAPGSFALLIKTHYAALGGALGAQLFAALHELSPESRASPPKTGHYFDRAPPAAQLILQAAGAAVRAPVEVLRYTAMHAQPILTWGGAQLRALSRRLLLRPQDDAAAAPQVVRTRFNAPVSPHRVVGGASFALADVERIRDQVQGATVLDVALAVIGGGLCRYLDAHMERPDASLVAEVPMFSRSDTRVYARRTLADATRMSLQTDIEDPLERLRAIVEDARLRRADVENYLARRLLLDAVEFAPEALLGAGVGVARLLRLPGGLGPLANTTVASVRGPDAPLYLAGARLAAYYGLPSLSAISGLAHLVTFYHDSMTIGVTCCRAMLPDPARYMACLQRAYAELGPARAAGVAAPATRAPGEAASAKRRPSRTRGRDDDRGPHAVH